ncbi:MAG: L-seryl-tRNA(Sec) selenium transferase [Candidatus Magnetomorum sp.]|nr:L-seryl-tRNA(Sec) selenium transferase [Candidatus Magnetomorum sp.]
MQPPDFIKKIPKVDRLYQQLSVQADVQHIPRSVAIQTIQYVLETLRQSILDGQKNADDISEPLVLEEIITQLIRKMQPNLRSVINASGIIVHTNLGRSVLPAEVIDHMVTIAGHYSNLEYDLDTGKRGQRYKLVESLICSLTGAEAATVVNNNAGAVLLALQTLTAGKAVIVSRGELVEIGGSFRIPDIMALSGAHLVEVGTTNRTHLKDYETAITPETGLLLKVHQSNYAITGFTASVSLKEMVSLGRSMQIPVMNDMGSGNLVDLSVMGLKNELMVQEVISAGVDIVTFSGDKLLGGPQAGLIVGKQSMIDAVRKNPLARALRIDKLTLAALEATLRMYQDPKTVVEKIPTLRFMFRQPEEIKQCAEQLLESLGKLKPETVHMTIVKKDSKIGGGALPLQTLPTYCISIVSESMSSHKMDQHFRTCKPPIIGRIEDDHYLLDCRTILPDDIPVVASAMWGNDE